jgi:hypothetical protein
VECWLLRYFTKLCLFWKRVESYEGFGLEAKVEKI